MTSETRTFTGLGSNNYTFNYSYNLGGQLTQAIYVAPSFNKNINYAYNSKGALNGIGTNLIGSDPTTTTNVISGMSYRAFGAASSVSYGNNRNATLSYNVDLMRMTQMEVARPNGTDKIMNNSYSYAENGLISFIHDAVDSTYSKNYYYNYRNQLVQVGTWGATTYTMDDWGNQTSRYVSSVTTTFNYAKISGTQVPATNRLSSMTVNYGTPMNFTYDNAGNMTAAGSTTYQWDAANRLKSVNNGSLGSYGYDGNGKRVRKTESGTTTYYVISSVLGSVMEVTSAGVQRAYVMSGSSVVAQLNPNGQFYWLHLDHLGSGRKMTDSAGNMTYRAEFDPYGKLLYEWSSPTNLNTRKFTGYERDAATNLDYAQARMYASDWGRFMSPDPKGMGAASKSSPKSFNRYSYVEGNPVNNVDPTGTDYIDWDWNFFARSQCQLQGGFLRSGNDGGYVCWLPNSKPFKDALKAVDEYKKTIKCSFNVDLITFSSGLSDVQIQSIENRIRKYMVDNLGLNEEDVTFLDDPSPFSYTVSLWATASERLSGEYLPLGYAGSEVYVARHVDAPSDPFNRKYSQVERDVKNGKYNLANAPTYLTGYVAGTVLHEVLAHGVLGNYHSENSNSILQGPPKPNTPNPIKVIDPNRLGVTGNEKDMIRRRLCR